VKKKTILFAVIVFGVLTSIYFLFCPIIIGKADDLIPISKELEKGDIIKPLEGLNVTEIYIVFSSSDFSDLPEELTKTKVLRATKSEQIEKFKNLFEFTYSGGDLATCESFICAYDNGNLVFKSYLAVTKNQRFGLQNSVYGWAVSDNSSELIKLLKEFKPYRYPFLFL
jgi:hypothetical protein